MCRALVLLQHTAVLCLRNSNKHHLQRQGQQQEEEQQLQQAVLWRGAVQVTASSWM